MYRHCCVPNCDSERKDVKLHKLPVDQDRAKLWLKVIKSCASSSAASEFEALTWTEFTKSHVCHKHFESKYVRPSMKLTSNACPTLFTLREMRSGKPANIQTEIESMERARRMRNDHSYTMKHHYDHTYTKAAVFPEDVNVTDNAPNICQTCPASVTGCDTEVVASHSVQQYNSSTSTPNLDITLNISQSCTASVTSCDTEVVAGHSVNTTTPNLDSLQTNLTPKKRKNMVSRKRIVSNIGKLSPRCLKLYELHKKAKKQLNYSRRADMAKKVSKEHSFNKLVQGMNSVAQKFLWMQIKQCTRSKKGRRFNLEEKVIALSIMKQSPKCYRFLQRIFILPSKTTLNKLLGHVKIEAGINPQVFEVMKQEVSGWKGNKKLCSIIFDEMKLEPGVTYARKADKIRGFVELSEKTDRYADHALVFILKGALYKWQQPMAFYYSEGAASGIQMKAIIKALVQAVCDTGLQPIALISDQGTTFQNAFKSLQEDTRRSQILAGEDIDDTIHLSGQCLSVIYDPPHLIKGIRNNFLTKNMIMNGKVSKWQDLVDVYRTDCQHAQMRLLHKLNDEHILPEKIKKMKVKNCVRVFSKTMAAALAYTASFSHYADGTPVSETLSNTASLITFFDDLFDSVNGSSTHHKHTRGKKLRTAVTRDSDHHAFWAKAIETLKNIKYVDAQGKRSSVPSLNNWITTLKSFQRLWRSFSEKSINIMRPRYLNSDAIENFFGRVRSYNARNNDPTSHAFACTFKALFVTSLIKFHEKSYNCEDDCSEQVLNIQSLFSGTRTLDDLSPGVKSADPVPSSSATARPVPAPADVGSSAERLRRQATRERLDVHSRAYTAGWVVRKVLKSFHCAQCENDFATDDPAAIHKWIRHREYEHMKKNKLSYPSVLALRAFSYVVKESNNYLEENAHRNNLHEQISEILLSKYSLDFMKCKTHQSSIRDHFLSVSVSLCIFNWCNTINKILKGTDIFRLDRNNLPRMQAQAFRKFTKRLRNKSLYK